MKSHKENGIKRIALLQDYQNRPENLVDLLEEVAAKGYAGVDTWADYENMEVVRRFCERAHSLGLSVGFATCYMINQFKHIAKYPEQRCVEAVPGLDVDGLGTDSWGCPFNPDFKKRYFDQLRLLSSYPGVSRILVNDEASMSNGCYCPGCLAEYKRQFGGEPPRLANVTAENWSDLRWRQFLRWRIDRWNDVHGEMRYAIHAVNPEVLVGFQTSPAVDLWKNPWSSAVDLHGMARKLDLISVDPYYTSHCPPGFQPIESYLSEWCRFLKGIMPEGKPAEVVVQGFSHPNFTRPMNESDAYWAALVPPACGIDYVMPYSYTLQRCSPMQKPYEKCFAFDSYFRQTRPLKYAAVVHGVQTEVFAHPLPRDVPASFDGTRLFAVAESLRHHGVPYGYFPDGKLDDSSALREYKVVILPQVECLSKEQENGIRSFVENGGNLVIVGALGISDAIGSPRAGSFLEELTGIQVTNLTEQERDITFRAGLEISSKIQTVDERAAGYWHGAYKPVCRLRYCVDASVPSDADVLANFADVAGGASDRPAVVSLKRGGRIVWFAGFPSRCTVNPALGSEVQNAAYHWFSALAEFAAGAAPSIRVEGWPPIVPIRELRPTDRRHMSTFDFFPLQGDDISLALITSYFREPAKFPLVFDLPAGKEISAVRELISGENLKFSRDSIVNVEMDFDTPAKLYLFETKSFRK
jgi:hypothetical protein